MRYGVMIFVVSCCGVGCSALGNTVENAARDRAVKAIDARADELGVELAKYGISRDDEPADALRKIVATEAAAGNSEVVKAVSQARTLSEALALLATNAAVLTNAEKRQAELVASKGLATKIGGALVTLLAALALGLARVAIARGRGKAEAEGQKTKLEQAFDYVLSRIEAAGPDAGPVKEAIAKPPPGDASAVKAAAIVAAAVKEKFR